jgi:type II secretory pathway component PulK
MSRPIRKGLRRDRAIILVLVLWIIVILSLMAYSLLFQISSETSITSARKKQLKAEALARAGIAKAIVDLRNDILFDYVEGEKVFDGEGDLWARPEEGKTEVVLGDEKDGYYSVRVFDEESLINLNRITPANMMVLQKILEKIGYSEEDAKLAAAIVVDWRDGDFVPTLPNSPSNDEGKAYAIMKAEDEGGPSREEDIQPLVMRNEDFLTVDELLEVYGITPQLYFGPDSAEAEYFEKEMGDRYAYGDLFQLEEKRRRKGDEPLPGLREYFTIYGSGVLNINTAPAHVLAALAEASGQSDGENFAERVLRTRRGGKDDDIDNDGAFKDTTELLANAEIQSVVVAGGNLLNIGVSSTTFRIVSEGVVGDVKCRMEVLAARALTPFNRDDSFESIDRAQEQRDQQSGRWKRREDSKNSQSVKYPYVRIFQAYQD